MRQKRLMLLGGLRYLKPVIDAAHELGYYVITADYLPGNIAHEWSDEYCNVSIIDKEAVLREARRLRIDGIMSFACDPGVISASYVQNMLGLPSFGPFESVEILQNKDKFRSFLSQNGFNVPKAQGFDSYESAAEMSGAFSWPVIVKPTDSAGSKGVTKVVRPEDLKSAFDKAKQNSISGRVIVEEFIEAAGCTSDSDSMSIDGQLVFTSFSAQRFDSNSSNPFTPAAYSWPSTFTAEEERYLVSEIQRLLDLLGMKTAVYNIETRIGSNGKPYIMELTPRGGGNRLCEMIRYSTGVDLITAITRYCVGDPFPKSIGQERSSGYWAEIILHSDKSGVFQDMVIDSGFGLQVVDRDLWAKEGDSVKSFNGANDSIGTLVLRFESSSALDYAMGNVREWLHINVR